MKHLLERALKSGSNIHIYTISANSFEGHSICPVKLPAGEQDHAFFKLINPNYSVSGDFVIPCKLNLS